MPPLSTIICYKKTFWQCIVYILLPIMQIISAVSFLSLFLQYLVVGIVENEKKFVPHYSKKKNFKSWTRLYMQWSIIFCCFFVDWHRKRSRSIKTDQKQVKLLFWFTFQKKKKKFFQVILNKIDYIITSKFFFIFLFWWSCDTELIHFCCLSNF